MTVALLVLGIVLSVVAGYASDALGLPPLGRGLVVGVVIGLTVLLVSRRMRHNGQSS